MLEKVTRLAEKAASRAGLSRRGFLERIGQGALALAGVVGGALAIPRAARAGAKVCTNNGQCGRHQYCSKPTADCGGNGTCQPRPQVCYELYLPVCGCNGKTYSNSCFAAMAGVNVLHNGAC
jgi:hypothetical protein